MQVYHAACPFFPSTLCVPLSLPPTPLLPEHPSSHQVGPWAGVPGLVIVSKTGSEISTGQQETKPSRGPGIERRAQDARRAVLGFGKVRAGKGASGRVRKITGFSERLQACQMLIKEPLHLPGPPPLIGRPPSTCIQCLYPRGSLNRRNEGCISFPHAREKSSVGRNGKDE